MTNQNRNQSPSQRSIRIPHPRGLLRLAMRFPILLYQLNLGWLLGKRFLMLEHRGRKTGLLRQTVIEVVDHNPRDGSFVVAAAWGDKSDWYKNIIVQPQVTIVVGTSRFPVFARTLPMEEATQHLNAYAKRHPTAFKQLGSLLVGQKSSDSGRIIESFASSMPLVAFMPTGKT